MEVDPLSIEGSAEGGAPELQAEPAPPTEPESPQFAVELEPEPQPVSVPDPEPEPKAESMPESEPKLEVKVGSSVEVEVEVEPGSSSWSRRRCVRRCAVEPATWQSDSDGDLSGGSDDDYRPQQTKKTPARWSNKVPRRARRKRKASLAMEPPLLLSPMPSRSAARSNLPPPPAGVLSFMPIKIQAVNIDPATSSPSPSFVPKPPTPKKPSLSLHQRQVHCEILQRHITATKDLGLTLAHKSEEFISKKINTDVIQNMDGLLLSARKSFKLFELAKESLNTLENKFRKEIANYMSVNKFDEITKKDPILRNKMFANGETKTEEADSDCEIIDVDQTFDTPNVMTKIEPGIFDTLKKIEKCGVSWKNCTPPNNYNIMISDVRSQPHNIWLNKDITLKRVPAKKVNNSFFWMDSRTLKPPDDNIVRRALITYSDITSKIKSAVKFGWLDLADRVTESFKLSSSFENIYRVNFVEDFTDSKEPQLTGESSLVELKNLSFDLPFVKTLKELCSECLEANPTRRKHISEQPPDNLTPINSVEDRFEGESDSPSQKTSSTDEFSDSNNEDLSTENININYNRNSNLLAKAAMLDESSSSESYRSDNEKLETDEPPIDSDAKNLTPKISDFILKDRRVSYNEPNNKENISGFDFNTILCDDSVSDDKENSEIMKSKKRIFDESKYIDKKCDNDFNSESINRRRKNIHKIITDESLADSTKQALNEEKCRLKRLAEKDHVIRFFSTVF